MVSRKKEFFLLMCLCSLILIRTYSALSLKGIKENDPPSLMNYNKVNHGSTLKGSKDDLIKRIVQDVSYDIDNFINYQYDNNNNNNNHMRMEKISEKVKELQNDDKLLNMKNNSYKYNSNNNNMKYKNNKINDYIKGDTKVYKNQNNNSENEKNLEIDDTMSIKSLQNRPLLITNNKEKNDKIEMKDSIKSIHKIYKEEDNNKSYDEGILNNRVHNNDENYMREEKTGNMSFKLNNLNKKKSIIKNNMNGTKENYTDINNNMIKINNIKKDIPNLDNNNYNNVKSSMDNKSTKLEKSVVNNSSMRNIQKKNNNRNILNKNDQSKERETSNEHVQMNSKKKYTTNRKNNDKNNDVDDDNNTTIQNNESTNISSTHEHKNISTNNQNRQELLNENHHKNKLNEISYNGDAIEIRIISDPILVKNDHKKTQKNKKHDVEEKDLLRIKNGKRIKWLKGVLDKTSKRIEVETERDHIKGRRNNFKQKRKRNKKDINKKFTIKTNDKNKKNKISYIQRYMDKNNSDKYSKKLNEDSLFNKLSDDQTFDEDISLENGDIDSNMSKKKINEDKNLLKFVDEGMKDIGSTENEMIKNKKNIIKNSRKVYNLNLYNCDLIDDWDLNHEYIDEEGKLIKLSGYVFQNIVSTDSMPTVNITDWKLRGSCSYDNYICGALNYMNNIYSKGDRVIFDGKIYEATTEVYETPKGMENLWIEKTNDCYDF